MRSRWRIIAHCSLHTTHYSLLATHYSLLTQAEDLIFESISERITQLELEIDVAIKQHYSQQAEEVESPHLVVEEEEVVVSDTQQVAWHGMCPPLYTEGGSHPVHRGRVANVQERWVYHRHDVGDAREGIEPFYVALCERSQVSRGGCLLHCEAYFPPPEMGTEMEEGSHVAFKSTCRDVSDGSLDNSLCVCNLVWQRCSRSC